MVYQKKNVTLYVMSQTYEKSKLFYTQLTMQLNRILHLIGRITSHTNQKSMITQTF